ncbi:pteridine reductase [Ahniella affigens]|uniref:Pteridine reductase n=1 Tax=Ahniella affigens TaxID=2021234 RepID=A0A2P1PMD7_9GAMM|nr:pteridine reductase [Ahniella affigens]AVP96013.1 pteridine reductase [Ahniella affigens]
MSEAQNPVVLITGAARRVGAEIVRHVHRAGYEIALHTRDPSPEALALQAELESIRPGSSLLCHADLGNTTALPDLIDTTLARFGRLDALINNASTFCPTPIGSTTELQWDTLFASNAKAPFFLAQAAAPALRQSQGCIINITDVYGERPLLQHTVYAMAKAALRMLTLSLARELGPEIRVNAVAPGAILWPESGKSEAAKQSLLDKTALRRVGEPADIARTVLFLLRDAPYLTGEVIKVDGGRSLVI